MMKRRIVFVNKSKLNIIFGIGSFIIALFLATRTGLPEGYELDFVIPLVFGIINLFFPWINYTDTRSIGPLVLSYTMLMKYMISPLLSYFGNYYSWLGIAPSESDIRAAIWLTLYEMIILSIESSLLSRHFEKKRDVIESRTIYPIKNHVIYILFIFLALVVIVAIPQTISDYRFIFNTSDLATTIRVDFPLSGLYKTIVSFSRYMIVLMIISFFYKRNIKRHSLSNIIGATIPVVLNSLVTSNLSRIGIFVPIITFVVLLLSIFNEKEQRKFILSFVGIVGVVIIAFISFQKFFGTGRGNVSNSNSIYWWSDTINMYFMGIKETAIGIKTIPLIQSTYGFNRPLLFIRDCLSNVIGLSNLVDSSKNSTALFNYIYFGKYVRSQIVPNSCEGVYYFGYILAPLWPGLFVYLSYVFSNKYRRAKYLDDKFANIFCSVFCGMVLMLNSSDIISWVINVGLLFLIVAYFNRKVSVKKRYYQTN